jgi:hypothetical protein
MAPRAHAWSGGAPGRRPEPARRRRDGVAALQQGVGNRAFGALMRRQLQRDPKTFEEEVPIGGIAYSKDGVNVSSGVSEDLLTAAQKLLAKGAIKDVKDLAALRKIALKDETVSDAERLFLAALLDPANADRIKAFDLKKQDGPPLKLKFALDDATAKRLREVADMGRPAKAGGDIAGLAGDSSRVQKHAAALVKFAKERDVAVKDILEAMRAAASDSTAGDMVAAGTVYAIAAAAKHPRADDIKAGRIKVDEMPLDDQGKYMPTATGGLLKGDTVYLGLSFDIGDLNDRDTVIHELEHATQDKPEKGLVVKAGAELEPDAYVAGAGYVLDEIAALPEKKRADQTKKLVDKWGRVELFAAVIAARKASDRRLPVLKAINAALGKKALTDHELAMKDEELTEHLVLALGASARRQTGLSGFSGESVFDLKRAQTK